MVRSSRALLAALSVALLAGCSSSDGGPAVSTFPVPPALPSQQVPTGIARDTPQRCGPGAVAFWLPGPQHSVLEANSVGSGPSGVVFLHQAGSGADMCGFWDYAHWLAEHERVRVVLFNRCTYGRSTCEVFQHGDPGIVGQVGPAVNWLHRHGARTVTLVGASSGGSDALQAGGVVPRVDAIVDLSGSAPDTGFDDLYSARRLGVPALFVVAPGDATTPVAELRATYQLVPGADKRFVVARDAPGQHGWDLLEDVPGGAVSRIGRLVADWVTRRRG
jgi:dienelactone hydrolase